MPVLSRFYGIVIRMYFLQSEHNPPLIHAIYNEDVAAIDFMTGDVLERTSSPESVNDGTRMAVHSQKCFTGNLGDTRISEAPAIRIRRCLYVS